MNDFITPGSGGAGHSRPIFFPHAFLVPGIVLHALSGEN